MSQVTQGTPLSTPVAPYSRLSSTGVYQGAPQAAQGGFLFFFHHLDLNWGLSGTPQADQGSGYFLFSFPSSSSSSTTLISTGAYQGHPRQIKAAASSSSSTTLTSTGAYQGHPRQIKAAASSSVWVCCLGVVVLGGFGVWDLIGVFRGAL